MICRDNKDAEIFPILVPYEGRRIKMNTPENLATAPEELPIPSEAQLRELARAKDGLIEDLERMYRDLEAFVHREGIQVVTMCSPGPWDDLNDRVAELVNECGFILPWHEYYNIAGEMATRLNDVLKSFVERCENTLFVFAAGNDGMKLEEAYTGLLG